MSEPRDCRCPNCHCPTGTRNPDGLCRSCGSGACKGERKQAVWEPEWIHRIAKNAHDFTDEVKA